MSFTAKTLLSSGNVSNPSHMASEESVSKPFLCKVQKLSKRVEQRFSALKPRKQRSLCSWKAPSFRLIVPSKMTHNVQNAVICVLKGAVYSQYPATVQLDSHCFELNGSRARPGPESRS
jgi:hypothetical protein